MLKQLDLFAAPSGLAFGSLKLSIGVEQVVLIIKKGGSVGQAANLVVVVRGLVLH